MRRGEILAIAWALGLVIACDEAGGVQGSVDTSPSAKDTVEADASAPGEDAQAATDATVPQDTPIDDTAAPQDVGATGDADGQTSCGAPPDAMCVTACGADSALQPICEAGAWTCPQGTIFADTCPPDTCIGAPPPCCDEHGVEVAQATCEAAAWTCPGESTLDCEATGECPGGQVPTVDGCLSCSDVAGIVSAIKAEAVGLYSGCISDGDCILVSQDTACAGACPTAIGAQNADAFADVLAMIDGDYCSTETVATCGYATPDCAPTTPKCNDGACEAALGVN